MICAANVDRDSPPPEVNGLQRVKLRQGCRKTRNAEEDSAECLEAKFYPAY